ncbi:MAG: hydroxymethylglutaryl-CoA lyase [Phycisphaerae bacterium]|nr:hydroxymethylglutaryl-CoA lyase [Phycisphaerae bacterium]
MSSGERRDSGRDTLNSRRHYHAPVTDHVRITDVSPRDGLQNEPAIVPSADKARLVELLADSGVDEVEVTSFVSPKWVPQLGDAEEVLSALPRGGGGRPIFSVLVPNEKGFDRALAIHRAGRPLKIAVFTAASETFSRKNTNASIAESIERFRAFIPRAVHEKMPIRAYVSCAVACPFEGPIAPSAVRRVTDSLLELFDSDDARAALDIDLGDTIGVAHPKQIEALLSEFEEDLRDNQLTLHLHDTFGRAASCVRTALDLGVRSYDGSIAGLGGCPYAGTTERRAPGNIATETLVRTIHAAGFSTRVNLDRLAEAASFASTLVGRQDGRPDGREP